MSDISYSENQLKAIRGLASEWSASQTRTEGERDLQKEAIKAICSEHELDPKVIRKMVKIFHKSQFNTVKMDNAVLEESYQKVFGDDQI
jgi:AraC-like DNA-binding protein